MAHKVLIINETKQSDETAPLSVLKTKAGGPVLDRFTLSEGKSVVLELADDEIVMVNPAEAD